MACCVLPLSSCESCVIFTKINDLPSFPAYSGSELVEVENYVKWQLALPYLPLLSSDFRGVVESFYESTGVEGGVVDCVDVVQNSLPFVVSRLYTKSEVIPGTREKVRDGSTEYGEGIYFLLSIHLTTPHSPPHNTSLSTSQHLTLHLTTPLSPRNTSCEYSPSTCVPFSPHHS